MGWHAIRRTLTSLLFQGGLSLPEVNTFMRWKRSTHEMALRYTSSQVISMDGQAPSLGLFSAELDQRAFEANPWLSTWGEFEHASP